MDEPLMFTSPSGDELVIMPRADYDALLAAAIAQDEEAADIAMFDERMATLARTQNAHFPAEVSHFMLQGDSRLRAIRKWRGLGQSELAARVKLGQGYISDIETTRRSGSPETISAIAAALDVPIDWLA